jgi:hypothetical protein
MGVNWCVFAIQRLRDYENKKQAIKSINEQIQILKEKYVSIRSATTDGTPVQDNNNKREEMLIYNISKREELQRNLKIITHEIKITENGLNVLTCEEKKILNDFFINRRKDYILRLCDELHISKTELYRSKDEALKKFTVACYGIVEF